MRCTHVHVVMGTFVCVWTGGWLGFVSLRLKMRVDRRKSDLIFEMRFKKRPPRRHSDPAFSFSLEARSAQRS